MAIQLPELLNVLLSASSVTKPVIVPELLTVTLLAEAYRASPVPSTGPVAVTVPELSMVTVEYAVALPESLAIATIPVGYAPLTTTEPELSTVTFAWPAPSPLSTAIVPACA